MLQDSNFNVPIILLNTKPFYSDSEKQEQWGSKKLIIKIDSQVVAEHIKKDYKARDPGLAKYLQFFRE